MMEETLLSNYLPQTIIILLHQSVCTYLWRQSGVLSVELGHYQTEL